MKAFLAKWGIGLVLLWLTVVCTAAFIATYLQPGGPF